MGNTRELDCQTLRDMAGDVEDGIAFGGRESEFYNEQGQPYGEFAQAATDEYARRTGWAPEDPNAVATALKSIIDSPEGQANIADLTEQADEEVENLMESLDEDSFEDDEFDDADDTDTI